MPHSFGGACYFGRNGFRHLIAKGQFPAACGGDGLSLLFRLVSVIFRHMDIMQPIYEPHTKKLCRAIP
jgi:hypothetical protein